MTHLAPFLGSYFLQPTYQFLPNHCLSSLYWTCQKCQANCSCLVSFVHFDLVRLSDHFYLLHIRFFSSEQSFFLSYHLLPALDASATLPRLDLSLALFLSSLAPSFPLRPTFEVAPFSGNFAFEAASLPFLASAPDFPSSSMLYLLRRAFFWRASSSICKLCLLKAAPFLTRLITCFTLKKT